MYIGVILIFGSTFADDLFYKDDYFRAIPEYKRELFFRKDTRDATAKIAISYFKLSQLEEAIDWSSKAYYKNPLYKFEYEYMLCKAGKLDEAKMLLSTRDVNEREKKLKKIIHLSEEERDYWKTSFIIPGSGQMISGGIWDGIFSFALNTGSLYLFYKRAQKNDLAGSFFAFSYFIRFYIGNINTAKKAERLKREKDFQRNLERLKKEHLP